MAATHHISSSSSSSTISAGSKINYEVFLSFHGKDVRNNFADHLYTALIEAGFQTFRDSEKLLKGNKIEEDLLAAIQQSKISIPILSENYAFSKWCLRELAYICECRRKLKQIVMPIFYKVEPREVRGQKNKYKEAFEQHLINMVPDVQKWKDALKEVGDLDGWHVKDETPQAQMIKQVVKEVYDKLDRRSFCENYSLVGAESHIDKIFMLLDIKSENRKIIGIHGLGGIGKTTIAKSIYNEVFNHFEGCSFIANVREAAQQHNGLVVLQNQLLHDTLKHKGQDIPSVDVGTNVIQQRLCSKKVLIVLDDVDQEVQVRAFVGDRKWFGFGSKIVITSRNKQILNFLEPDGIYEPPPMNPKDSLQLFSHHAFKINHPPNDFSDLSKAMVETTGGLPLALKVIGSSLFLKGKPLWKDMLEKLHKVPNNDIMERLRISFDGLDDEEKQMFLDSACFFIGMDKEIVSYIWKGCGFHPLVGLESLFEKSLITITEEGMLGMHDLLRDLGRSIVCQENANEPGKRTRIWYQEDVLKVLYTQTGTSSVLGLDIDFRSIPKNESLSNKGFDGMTCLRLLRIDGAKFSWDFPHSFSELRWLSWNGCPNQFNQTSFYPINLVVLDLSNSDITADWMGWNYIKMAKNLKVLDLSQCEQLSRTPDLSENQLLENLHLGSCMELEEIDTSICHLTNLLTLNMSWCSKLRVLPRQMGNLINLQELDLECITLEKLPENLGRMVSLIDLDLDLSLWHEGSVMDLLVEISQMTALRRLYLSSCTSLTGMSCLSPSLTSLSVSCCNSLKNISSLPPSLTSLFLWACNSLENIPSLPPSLTSLSVTLCSSLKNISSLPLSLTSLCVDRCISIQNISGLPSSLISLKVQQCSSVVKVSSTSRGLRNLKTLNVYSCKSLEEIEGFDDVNASLESFEIGELEILDCDSLRRIPYLQDSKRLRKLIIKKYPAILEIGCLGNFESLQELMIEDLGELTKISGLDRLRSLRTMTIKSCKNLLKIDGIDGSLENLEKLNISCCKSLERLPDLSNCNKLTHLEIEGCNNLNENLVVGEMESLLSFCITGCGSLRRLTNLSNSRRLKKLLIVGCKILTEIHGTDRLENLEVLGIIGCESLESVTDVSNLKRLTRLLMGGCKNLTKIKGIKTLESLCSLDIIGCDSFEILSNLPNLKKLINLRIEGSKNLTKIQDLDTLESLESLYINGCESLEVLRDLSNLKRLNYVHIKDCRNLTEIQGIDTLESLKNLYIYGCESLEVLPDLSNLKRLNYVDIEDCGNLTENQGVDALEALEELCITGCESLEIISLDLSNMKHLRFVIVKDCKKLTAIQAGNNPLESFSYLDVRGCISLEKVPDYVFSKGLDRLNGVSCMNLTDTDRIRLLIDGGCSKFQVALS